MIKIISGSVTEVQREIEDYEDAGYKIEILKQTVVHRPKYALSEILYLSIKLTN
jgi:hypothetical protein